MNKRSHNKFQPKHGYILQGKHVTLFEYIQFIVEEFLSSPLVQRLEKLSEKLLSIDPVLSKQISNIKEEVEKDSWGVAKSTEKGTEITITLGGQDSSPIIIDEDRSITMPGIMFRVNAFIEGDLISAILFILQQKMVEALVGADYTPERYQSHMRSAAGLKPELAADTERFLMRLEQRLYRDARKKWMNIHAGGSKSPLDKYQGALATHYERLHPIWKQAKKIYRKHGGGIKGREAVKREYQNWSPFIEGTLGAKNPNPSHIGLPDELISKLEPQRADAKEYDSSPEYIAHEHAAFLCNFKIGDYSVRQIKAAIRAHKRMLGNEYYNHLYKGQPMSL
ncbi:MAG: hypothetical protein JO360_11590 [Acidobacteria bacterium]|nr:hypothetical protein [Acidobacteriota bacterium]